jgi:hypothetical protein
MPTRLKNCYFLQVHNQANPHNIDVVTTVLTHLAGRIVMSIRRVQRQQQQQEQYSQPPPSQQQPQPPVGQPPK